MAGLPRVTWAAGSLPLGSEMAQAWGVPGFSLVTLDDARVWRDTPNDVAAKVKVDRVLPQVAAVRDLIRSSWGDASFRSTAEKRPVRMTFTGQVVSAAPDRPIPDIPREGFLATFYYVQNPATRIPGITFGGTFPRLAALADKVAVVRSYVAGDGNHDIKPIVGSDTFGANLGSIYSRILLSNWNEGGLEKVLLLNILFDHP